MAFPQRRILCGIAALLVSTPAAAEAGVLTLSPSLAAPAATVKVTAPDYEPGERITIELDGTTVASTTASPTGKLSATLKIPKTAAYGNHLVEAQGMTSGATPTAQLMVQTTWAQLGGTAAHLASSPVELMLSRRTAPELTALWRTPAVGATSTPPVLAGGRLITTGADGMAAFDALTGAPSWRTTTGHFGTGPTAAGSAIGAVDTTGSLRLISPVSGAVTATAPGSSPCACGPANVGSLMTVADTGSEKVRGVTVAGKTKWSTDVGLGGLAEGAPAISSNGSTAYVLGEAETGVYALVAGTGAQKWSSGLPTGDTSSGSPVATTQGVFVAGASGSLYGFDASTGDALGGFPVAALPEGGGPQSGPAFLNGVIVVAGRTAVAAVSAKSGALMWRVPLPADALDAGFPAVAMANGVIYATAGHRLLAFAQADGSLLLDIANPTGDAFTGPVLANGRVYVADAGTGAVTAYGLAAPNSAPAPPASIAVDPRVSGDGAVAIRWSGVTDPDGDPISYELQRAPVTALDDSAFGALPGWTTVAAGLTATSYAFGADGHPAEPEGRWQYRIGATDGQHPSQFSAPTGEVVVDVTPPTAPVGTTPAPDWVDPADAGDAWWRDSVTVSFGGSQDLAADGSPGSGVAGYAFDPDPATFSTTGSHTATARATDAAGHRSALGTADVAVDSSPPIVAFDACPASIPLGEAASASWTASDAGSGVAGAAQGAVDLPADSVGGQSVTTPPVADHVGHEAVGATCEYLVVGPPAAAGKPRAPALSADGSFAVSWDPTSEPEGEPITYTLEHRRPGGEWSTVIADVAATSISLGTDEAPAEAEGRWTYRVRAGDGRLASVSEESDPTVVDATPPSAPQAAPDREPEWTDPGGGRWWRDRVTVTFSHSDDTGADGAPGSGVTGYTADPDPPTFTTAGEHTATGTAVDAAGRVSQPTSLTVNVDDEAPTAGFGDCPEYVLRNATASARWEATDTGAGLAGDTHGTVTLPSAPVGQHVVTSPAPVDQVGHSGAPASCTYPVVSPAAAHNQFKTRCEPALSESIDPIVYPGVAGVSHLHEFFGNTRLDSNSTPAQLLLDGAAMNTTCLNRFDTAAYWVPALYRDGVYVPPEFMKVYYTRVVGLTRSDGTPMKTAYEYPAAWQLVAGNSKSAGPQKTSVASYACTTKRGSFPVPPDCSAATSHLVAEVYFPSCWNGTYLGNGQADAKPFAPGLKRCPAGYDIQVPRLLVAAHYGSQPPDCRSTGDVRPCSTYTLSTRPSDPASIYQLHADFMNGWVTGPEEPNDDLDSLIAGCLNQRDYFDPCAVTDNVEDPSDEPG